MIATNIFAKKFTLLLISVIIILMIVSALNYRQNQQLADELEYKSMLLIKVLDLSINADRDLYQAHTACQHYLIKMSRGETDTQGELTAFTQNSMQALQGLTQARVLLHNNTLVEQEMREFETDYNRWFAHAQTMITLADSGRLQDALKLNNTHLQNAFLRLRKHYDVMGELARQLYNKAAIR